MYIYAVLEAPLSVMPQSGMTAPPRGEPSVPASIAAKSVARRSRKKVRLTTKFASVHGRALGSPSGRAGAKRLRGEQKGAPALSVMSLRSMPPLPHAGEAKRNL